MSDRVKAIQCPSCGAPLDMPQDGKRLFECAFCGATLEDQSPAREDPKKAPPTIVIHTQASERRKYIPAAAPETQRLNRVGWVVLAIVLCLVAAGVVIPLILTETIPIGDQADRVKVYSFGWLRLINADNDSAPDILAVTRNSDDTTRLVYIDFDSDPYKHWQSEPLGEDAGYSYNQVIADQNQIYLAYQNTLVVFNRQSGETAWQISMSDEITNICVGCLARIGDQVLTLTYDGILSAYAVQNGDALWNVRLNETPRHLLNLGDKAAVLDKEDDQIGLHIYDPATGSPLKTIVPACSGPDTFGFEPQILIYDPIFASSDGSKFYLPMSGSEYDCIQQWETAGLSLTWEIIYPKDTLYGLDHSEYLFTDRAFYVRSDQYGEEYAITHIDLADGAFKILFNAPDHELLPLQEQGDLLLAQATRRRGSAQYSLWGTSIEKPGQSWQFTPKAEDILDDNIDVVHQTGLWVAHATSDVVFVLEAFTELQGLTFHQLTPENGEVIESNTLVLGEEDDTYWLQLAGWHSGTVYLSVDDRILLINAKTAEEIARWPDD